MSDVTIIYFGNDWYAENRTSSHHIAQRFSRKNKVLYVECPGLRMPKGRSRDLRKIFAKLGKCFAKPEKIDSNFWVYSLFQIPLHRFSLIRKLNEKLILFSLKRVMRQLGIENPLLWFHIPHLFMVPGNLKAQGVIYYCIDNYSALPEVNKDAVQSMDDEMTRKADLVFAVSDPVYRSKQPDAKDLLLSPHGVDFDHFNQATKPEISIPSDIRNIAAPVIGFWGLIEKRIDLELVAAIAKNKPQWNFVLIGYVEDSVNPCTELPNVTFLGLRSFSDLPAYAKAFDVSILPYCMDDFFYNCNPLKLREYLATGKPVVSLRNPEIEKYGDVVHIANDTDDFMDKIALCLGHDTPELSEARIARVRSESWDSRVDDIMSAINDKFSVELKN